MSSTMSRKIFFSILDCKKQLKDVDVSTVIDFIDNLSFKDNSRYYETSNGQSLSIILEHKGDLANGIPVKGIIGKTRKIGLPTLEKKGNITSLDLPDTETGLYESTHFMIFPGNVIVYEFNFYAPRIISLAHYITQKMTSKETVAFIEPILKDDPTEILKNISKPKKMYIKAHRGMSLFSQLDKNLDSGFRALEKMNDAEYLEISMSIKPKRKEPLKLRFIKKLPEFINKNSEFLDKFEIHGESKNGNRNEVFDFLGDKLHSIKKVVQVDEIHRHIDSNDMFKALEESYNENESFLKTYVSSR